MYNEHPLYKILDAASLINELERFVPIRYDEISIAFVTGKTICDLHNRFLGSSDPTDIITFPAGTSDVEKIGELCISVDEALKYTSLQSLEDELTLYLSHGWLHLAGYDDVSEADQVVMKTMEQKTLQFLNMQDVQRVRVQKKIAARRSR